MHSGNLGRRCFVTSIAAALALGFSTTACNRQTGGSSTSGRPRIAFVMKTLNHPFFLDMKRGAEEAAEMLGPGKAPPAGDRQDRLAGERRVEQVPTASLEP